MTENVVSKPANVENKLARELVVARQKMNQRLIAEGMKPYYKQTSNKWTLIAALFGYLSYKVYMCDIGTADKSLSQSEG